jgi:hemerythrin superfamily protein
MFEFLTTNPAVELIKADHDRVKDLFDQFEAAKSRPAKLKVVREALVELKAHAAIEEELFYPAVRKPVGKEIMNEADEEHHVAKLLIAELDVMDGSESHFDAKFHVLAENVRHHIKEEEGEMLPKAKGVKLDFEALAEKMKRRKEKLLADGFPPAGEEKMVKASRGQGDSPARAAKRKPPKLPKRGK